MNGDWEDVAEALATSAVADGEPSRWFDELYAQAVGRLQHLMPWPRTEPYPLLVDWAAGRSGEGRRACIVGCGLQALPPPLHAGAGAAVGNLVAPGGSWLFVGALPNDENPPPWPLDVPELESLAVDGLVLTSVVETALPARPDAVRRRAEFRRPA